MLLCYYLVYGCVLINIFGKTSLSNDLRTPSDLPAPAQLSPQAFHVAQHRGTFSAEQRAEEWLWMELSMNYRNDEDWLEAIASRNKKLLGAPGIATRNKKLLGAPGIATRNKKLLGTPGIASRLEAIPSRLEATAQRIFLHWLHMSLEFFRWTPDSGWPEKD